MTVTLPHKTATSRILQRGRFTSSLLTWLATQLPSPVLLGDGEAPPGGGWTSFQPGEGAFVPYVSISTGQALPNLADTLARRLEASWSLTYVVMAAGASREQCEFALDAVRPILSALHGFVVSAGPTQNWKVQKSDYLALGVIRRNDSTDPPTFEGSDSLEIWVEPSP